MIKINKLEKVKHTLKKLELYFGEMKPNPITSPMYDNIREALSDIDELIDDLDYLIRKENLRELIVESVYEVLQKSGNE